MPVKASRLNKLAVWAGRALLVVALVFVGLKLRSHWQAVADWRPDGQDIAVLIALSALYCAALYLLAEGWHWIVNLFGHEARWRTYPSFTVTQIGKYIPGNFAHLVGRGLYLRGGSLSNPQLVLATLIELVAIPTGAAICIVVLGSTGQLEGVLPEIPTSLWYVFSLVPAVGIAGAVAIAGRRVENLQARLKGLAVCIGLSVVFMTCLGAVFAAIYHLFAAAPVAPLAGAAILSWLIGFLIPGAPGGIGIREAVLITLLAGIAQENTALLAGLLLRLVTTGGDLLLFATGWLISRKIRQPGTS